MTDKLKQRLGNINSKGAIAKAIYDEMMYEWHQCSSFWEKVKSYTPDDDVEDVNHANYVYHRHRCQLLIEIWDAIQGVK